MCLSTLTGHLYLQALFTTYSYHFPLLITFLQMSFIAPVCYLIARPALQWETVRGVAPLALVNVLNVVSGLLGVVAPAHQVLLVCLAAATAAAAGSMHQ